MMRHAYIIINHGEGDKYLANVDADKRNYLTYLTSPEGGAWDMDTEISVYEDNFHFQSFRQEMIAREQRQCMYDYVLIIFCGHGYSTPDGVRMFELYHTEDDSADVSLGDFVQVCENTRALFIADSCLSVYSRTSTIHRTTRMFSINESGERKNYINLCRSKYNEAVMQMPIGTFTAGFAVSLGEGADDDERGGYYSQKLLETAYERIDEMLNDNSEERLETASFARIHRQTYDKVVDVTKEKQHPSIQQPRFKNQLPFLVVPRKRIKPFL